MPDDLILMVGRIGEQRGSLLSVGRNKVPGIIDKWTRFADRKGKDRVRLACGTILQLLDHNDLDRRMVLPPALFLLSKEPARMDMMTGVFVSEDRFSLMPLNVKQTLKDLEARLVH